MIQITPQMRVLVAVQPTDFRRGIDGLAKQCRELLRSDPFSGAVFVFCNRLRTSIKLLVYAARALGSHRSVSRLVDFATGRKRASHRRRCKHTNCTSCCEAGIPARQRHHQNGDRSARASDVAFEIVPTFPIA